MISPDDVRLAAALVQDAGNLARRMLADGLDTEHKTSITDVVSAADRAAEDLVVARLRAERAEDGIVGEEGAAHPGARTWYVDPVDGTYNFLSGLPAWCSAVALVDTDGGELGAIYQPETAELWLGGTGVPAEANGQKLAPLEDRPLAELSVAMYLHPGTLPDESARVPILAVLRAAATVRMLGSGSVELAAVAAGRLGVWAQIDSAPWDWLPGAAIVRAAGGVAETFGHRGHRWHLAGPASAVAEARAVVLAS